MGDESATQDDILLLSFFSERNIRVWFAHFIQLDGADDMIATATKAAAEEDWRALKQAIWQAGGGESTYFVVELFINSSSARSDFKIVVEIFGSYMGAMRAGVRAHV